MIFSPDPLIFDLDTQLKFAKVLHEKFCNQHGISMRSAIALAPAILELAVKCCLAEVTPENIEQALVCNAPKHVENILKYLPEAINMVKTWSKPINIENVQENANQTSRDGILSKLFCPANSVAEWTNISFEEFQQLEGIEYIECLSIREEALAILLKAEELLNGTDQSVAIITNDKRLIKTLISLATLFKMRIRNDHGMLLEASKSMMFLKLLFQSALDKFSPISLLALFNHECFTFKDRAILQTLAIQYFRGVCKYNGLDELIDLVIQPEIKNFLITLRTKFLRLITLVSKESVSFQLLLDVTISAVLEISSLRKSDYEKLNLQSHENFINPQEFLPVLFGLISKFKQDSTVESPCRIRILPLEFCNSCVCPNIIFTGLNEPTADEHSNMIQVVSEIIGIPCQKPAERIQAEQLFYCMHQPRVLLTRSTIIAGIPQLPARWLVRLKLLEKKFQFNLNATYLLKKVAELYIPCKFIDYLPPNPAPQIMPRLTKLSVTQVEKLIKHPYSIYAQCLLKLKPLEEIDRMPNQADFGSFVHAVISEFAKSYDASLEDQKQLTKLNSYAQNVISSIVRDDNLRHLWMIRFYNFAKWLVDFQKPAEAKKFILKSAET